MHPFCSPHSYYTSHHQKIDNRFSTFLPEGSIVVDFKKANHEKTTRMIEALFSVTLWVDNRNMNLNCATLISLSCFPSLQPFASKLYEPGMLHMALDQRYQESFVIPPGYTVGMQKILVTITCVPYTPTIKALQPDVSNKGECASIITIIPG